MNFAKNGTGVTFNFTSNVIGESNDETNFQQKNIIDWPTKFEAS